MVCFFFFSDPNDGEYGQSDFDIIGETKNRALRLNGCVTRIKQVRIVHSRAGEHLKLDSHAAFVPRT